MWICKNCGQKNEDTVKDCEKCGIVPAAQPSKPDPATVLLQKYEASFRRANPSENYSTLEIFSVILTVAGILGLLIGIILGAVLGNAGYGFGFWTFLASTIAGVLVLAVSCAGAHLIHLFINMEKHTYETNMLAYISTRIQADQAIRPEQNIAP